MEKVCELWYMFPDIIDITLLAFTKTANFWKRTAVTLKVISVNHIQALNDNMLGLLFDS